MAFGGLRFDSTGKSSRKKKIKIELNLLFWKKNDVHTDMQMMLGCAVVKPNRKFNLINVEEAINEMESDSLESRVWPHLGILSVGTVAYEEGWEVVLHDELVEGYVNLEYLVEPGDIVGLSLVATGIERGIELARKAKELGASYVIAGNDSAIFRADQILSLSGRPIDAVFTSNSFRSIRQFFQNVQSYEIKDLEIPGIVTVPSGLNLSNEQNIIKRMRQKSKVDKKDVFVIPKLDLFSDHYWQKVWKNYQTVFGHKHKNPKEVKNAIALFAQGCTRACSGDVCSYCTIAGVNDIQIASRKYLERLIESYESFGINYFFNVTDSVFEMSRVCHQLKDLRACFHEGLLIYGRAWGLANKPEMIDEWLSLTGGRLLVNAGFDSGDEDILSRGIQKASINGSRLKENYQAVKNIKESGAHLHYSLIFGSPGETRESCERSLEFFEWTRSKLGTQLDQCEADLYWLNHGSPASRVFRDYNYARKLAGIAGKEISSESWSNHFYQYRDGLVVPWECQEAWYHFFTSITVEEAQGYVAKIAKGMANHEGAAPGRLYMSKKAFRPT